LLTTTLIPGAGGLGSPLKMSMRWWRPNWVGRFLTPVAGRPSGVTARGSDHLGWARLLAGSASGQPLPAGSPWRYDLAALPCRVGRRGDPSVVLVPPGMPAGPCYGGEEGPVAKWPLLRVHRCAGQRS